MGEARKRLVRTPWPRFIAMWLFILFTAVAPSLTWSQGPFGLPWGSFIVCWLAYLVLIVTTFWYILAKEGSEN